MFKPGRTYPMKGGGTYHVASLVFPGPKPIIGWDHKNRVTCRTLEGSYWLSGKPDRTDLIKDSRANAKITNRKNR